MVLESGAPKGAKEDRLLLKEVVEGAKGGFAKEDGEVGAPLSTPDQRCIGWPE